MDLGIRTSARVIWMALLVVAVVAILYAEVDGDAGPDGTSGIAGVAGLDDAPYSSKDPNKDDRKEKQGLSFRPLHDASSRSILSSANSLVCLVASLFFL